MANPFEDDVEAVVDQGPAPASEPLKPEKTPELSSEDNQLLNETMDEYDRGHQYSRFRQQALLESGDPEPDANVKEFAEANNISEKEAQKLLQAYAKPDAALLAKAEELSVTRPEIIEWAAKSPENYRFIRDNYPHMIKATDPEWSAETPILVQDLGKALKRNMPMLENMVAVGRYSVGELSKEEFAERLENIRQRRENQTPYGTDISGFQGALEEFNRSWKKGMSFADIRQMPREDLADYINLITQARVNSGATTIDILEFAYEAAFGNPAGTVLTSTESLGAVLGPTAGALSGSWLGARGGPKTAAVGGLVGGTIGSGLVRYAQEIEEQLNDYVDKNPGRTYIDALDDPEIMANIKKVALTYGLVGGALDTLLTRLGGNIATGGLRRRALGIGVDSAGEGVAEAGATTAKEVAKGKPALEAASEGLREGVVESILATPTSATLGFIPGVYQDALANKVLTAKRKTLAKVTAAQTKGQMDKIQEEAGEVVKTPEDAAKLRDVLDTLSRKEEVVRAEEEAEKESQKDIPPTVTEPEEDADAPAIPERQEEKPKTTAKRPKRRSKLREESILEQTETTPQGVAVNPEILYQKYKEMDAEQRGKEWEEYIKYYSKEVQEALTRRDSDTDVIFIDPREWAIANSVLKNMEDLYDVALIKTPWGLERVTEQDVVSKEDQVEKDKSRLTSEEQKIADSLTEEEKRPLTSEEQDDWWWFRDSQKEQEDDWDDPNNPAYKRFQRYEVRIKLFGEEEYVPVRERPGFRDLTKEKKEEKPKPKTKVDVESKLPDREVKGQEKGAKTEKTGEPKAFSRFESIEEEKAYKTLRKKISKALSNRDIVPWDGPTGDIDIVVVPEAVQIYTDLFFNMARFRAKAMGRSTVDVLNEYVFTETTDIDYAGFVSPLIGGINKLVIGYNKQSVSRNQLSVIVHEFGHVLLDNMLNDFDEIMAIPEERLTPIQEYYKETMKLTEKVLKTKNLKDAFDRANDHTILQERFATSIELFFKRGKFNDTDTGRLMLRFQQLMAEYMSKEQLQLVGQSYVHKGTSPIRPEGSDIPIVFNALIDANEKLIQNVYPLVPPPEFDRIDLGDKYKQWMKEYRAAVEVALLEVYTEIFNDNIDFYKAHFNPIFTEEYNKLLDSPEGILHNMMRDEFVIFSKKDLSESLGITETQAETLAKTYGFKLANTNEEANATVDNMSTKYYLTAYRPLEQSLMMAIKLEETAVANTIKVLEEQNETIPTKELTDLSDVILSHKNISDIRIKAGKIVKAKLIKELDSNKNIQASFKKEIKKGVTEKVLKQKAKLRAALEKHNYVSLQQIRYVEREIEDSFPEESFVVMTPTAKANIPQNHYRALQKLMDLTETESAQQELSQKDDKKKQVQEATDLGDIPSMFSAIEQLLVHEHKVKVIKKIQSHLEGINALWNRQRNNSEGVVVSKKGKPDIYIYDRIIGTKEMALAENYPTPVSFRVIKDDGIHDLASELMTKRESKNVWSRASYGHLIQEADLKARILTQLNYIPAKKVKKGTVITLKDVTELLEMELNASPARLGSPRSMKVARKVLDTLVPNKDIDKTTFDIKNIKKGYRNIYDMWLQMYKRLAVFDFKNKTIENEFNQKTNKVIKDYAKSKNAEKFLKDLQTVVTAFNSMDLLDNTYNLDIDAIPLPPIPKTEVKVGKKKLSYDETMAVVAKNIVKEVKTFKKAKDEPSNFVKKYIYTDSISIKNFIASMMEEKDLSKSWLYRLFHMVSEAESKKNTIQHQYHERITKAVKKFSKSRKDIKQTFGKEGINLYSFLTDFMIKNSKPILAHEIGQNVIFKNIGEVVTALLYMGSESGRAKMLLGGFINSEGVETGPLGVDKDGYIDSSGWDAFIQRLINEGVLTEEAFDFVQEVHNIFTEVYPLVKKSFKEVDGQDINFVSGRKYTLKFGDKTKTFNGGYYPLLPDRTLVPLDIMSDNPKLSNEQFSIVYDTLDSSMSKQRGGQLYPLQLGLGNIMGLLNKHLTHAYIKQPLQRIDNLRKNKAVVQALENHQKGFVKNILNPWIERVAKQRYAVSNPGFLNALGLHLRRATYITLFLLKLGPITRQLFGVIQAIPTTGQYVGNAKMLKHYIKTAGIFATGGYNRLRKDISEKSVFMKDRMDYNERNLVRGWDEMELSESVHGGIMSKGEQVAFFGMQTAQNIVDMGIWMAAVERVKQDGGTDNEAFAYADGLVERTQASGNIASRPKALHGTNWERLAMMISMVSHGIRGRIYENAVRAEQKGNSVMLARMNALVFMAIIPRIIEHVAAQMLQQMGDDGDDDPEIPELISQILADVSTAYAPQVAQILMPIIGGGVDELIGAKSRGRGGEILGLGPVAHPIRKGQRGFTALGRKLRYGVPMTYKDWGNLYTGLGAITGLPIAPIDTYIFQTLDARQSKIEKEQEARKRRKILDKVRKDK